MAKIRNFLEYLRHPADIPSRILWTIKGVLSDRKFIEVQYRLVFKTRLNLKNPQTYNEKLQWLKLYDRNPIYAKMADKYEVRDYVAQKIGEQYLIPLLGVWDRFDEIDFVKMPEQFVLKCTHDSGSIVICREKSGFDLNQARIKLESALRRNHYSYAREWVYKDLRPRIIAQPYLVDESGIDLRDYKVLCFYGEPKIIWVDIGRFIDHKRNIYSPAWEYQAFSLDYPTDPNIAIQKPASLGKLLDLARRLSSGLRHVRTDFHIIHDRILFGEMTFFSDGGYGKFDPPEWNRTFGDWLRLPN